MFAYDIISDMPIHDDRLQNLMSDRSYLEDTRTVEHSNYWLSCMVVQARLF